MQSITLTCSIQYTAASSPEDCSPTSLAHLPGVVTIANSGPENPEDIDIRDFIESDESDENDTSDDSVLTHLCKHCKPIGMARKRAGGSKGTPPFEYADDFNTYHRVDPADMPKTFPVASSPMGAGLWLPCYRKDILPDLPLLRDSAERGCPFCGLLRQAIMEKTWLQPLPDTAEENPPSEGTLAVVCARWVWYGTPANHLPRMDVAISIKDVRGATHKYRLHFEVTSTPGSCARWLWVKMEPPFEHALSERAAAKMKEWITKCEGSCHPIDATTFLPARLIDVGNDREEPRLVISSSISQQEQAPKYAALSYCWGPQTARTLKTESHSLEDRLRGIHLEDFPKTIRDAVLVTRALGLQYLWVDALCIIQDDKTDWEMESVRMSDIYWNSYITIIPFESSSCDDGFLARPSVPTADIPFRSSIDPKVKGNLTLHSRDKWAIGTAPLVTLQDSVWRTRGWTFQEEQMSRRKLLFSKDRTMFMCAETVEAETNADMDGHSYLELGGTGSRLGSVGGPDAFSGYLYSCDWDRPVTRHNSWRLLTYAEDRLPALSGLAASFHRGIPGDRYLAGHWQSHLYESLTWMPKQKQDITFEDALARVTRRPTVYIAPTWSWVSFGKEVECSQANDVYDKPFFNILEAETVLHGANPYGRISNGWLVLQAKCWPFSEVIDNPKASIETISEEDRRWRISWEGKLLFCCSPDWGDSTQVAGQPDWFKTGFLNRLLLLPCRLVDQSFDGIMLLHLEDQDVWVRVGVFEDLVSTEMYGPERGCYGADFFDDYETRTVKII